MNAGSIPADRPTNEGVIANVLDAQSENIGETQALVEKLYDRLKPVLAPATPANGRVEPADPSRKEPDENTSVRSRIKAHTRRVESVNMMLREISDRLEV